ncbi:MAG: ParB N-terminal domain-containing protein [Canibacter sp.]
MIGRLTEGQIERREWTMLPLEHVIVKERLREALDEDHVKRIMQSFTNLGLQINPITVDENHILVTGAHRLEAMRRLTDDGVNGWDEIGALVIGGATETDLRWIEVEENAARRSMSPIEIQKMWESYGEPVFQARARNRRNIAGVVAMNSGSQNDESTNDTVTPNRSNSEKREDLSLAAAARAVTGRKLDWLNKVSDIRQLAENERAPEPLRRAAQVGLTKLSQPDAAVEPVYKAVLKVQNAYMTRPESEEAARELEVDLHLERTVKDVTLLFERLDRGYADSLTEAARLGHLAEIVRGVRIHLAKSLALVLAAEVAVTNDRPATLNTFGGETMKLISDYAAQRLGLVSHD